MTNVPSILAIIVCGMLLAVAAPPTTANHCGPVIIFGRAAQVAGQNGGANAGGAGCTAVGEASPDVREITPASPNLQVRFIGSFAGVSSLTGTIVGLGLNQGITLASTGSVYDGAYLPINPLATGSVTATVNLPGGGTASATFTKSL